MSFMRWTVCAVLFTVLSLHAGDADAPKKLSEIGKAIADLGSADAAVREAGAKELLLGLKDVLPKADRPYLTKLGVDLNGENAAAKTAAATSLASMIEEFRNVDNADAVQKNKEKPFAKLMAKCDAADAKTVEEGKLILMQNLVAAYEWKELSKMIEDLASNDPAAIAATTKQFQAFGGDAASALVGALDDERLAVKKNAAEALKAMGPAAKDVASDLAFLLDNDNKSVRRLAGSVLENLGPEAASVASDMVSYLDNDEKPVRRQAAIILKKIGPAAKEVTSDLVDLLTGDDKNTRSLAAEVLESLGPHAKDGVEALGLIVDDTNGNDADSRLRATKILGAIGPDAKAALEILKKHQAEGEADLKEATLESIKKIEKK